MTTANKVTIVRILLVPFFIGLVHYFVATGQAWYRVAATVAFGLAAVSDGIDGYIARRYNQRSELGTFLDPIADKFLILSAIIVLSLDTHGYLARIPTWMTMTVLSRDVLLLLGFTVIHYKVGRTHARPRVAGKIATVLQMAVVVWILLRWDKWDVRPLLALEIGATLFTAVAALLYLWDGIKQLSVHPTSGPTAPER